MDGYLVHRVGIQTRMSRYSYTRACIFFFFSYSTAFLQEGRNTINQAGFLEGGSGGKRSMMCLLVTLLVLGEDRGR